MPFEIEQSQHFFLSSGGVFARALAAKRESGELPKNYVFHEYPKLLRISRGIEEIEKSTETSKGKTVTWIEKKEMFDDIVVSSEEEEERVLSGGKTSVAIEQDRQELLVRCRNMGILADPGWSAIRLRRELGDKLDAPEPKDERETLRARMAELEEIATMKARIAELEAKIKDPPPDDEMRVRLIEAGVQVDGRWSMNRLRQEYDKLVAA